MNELGERIAQGRTADVHLWKDGMVLKLFNPWFPAEDVHFEQRLMSLPSRTRLCHGDFHRGNVSLSGRGPVIIDWIDASIGYPGADVGRTLLLLEGEIATSGAGSVPVIVLLKLFIRAYLKGYRNHNEGSADSGLDQWRPILAAVRMAEGIDELNPWLFDVVMESEAEGYE